MSAAFEIRAAPGGVEFAVHASPGSSKAGVRGLHGAALKVAVNAPPEKGKANAALERLLAEVLGVPPKAVTVVAGLASRQKRVRVQGLDAQTARKRLGI
ncbi:MAG: DUF167 domain-containing protein [Planctomycetota bacterium]|nr:DUF167 domain-containing protein [Planctomycetota bacterium]